MGMFENIVFLHITLRKVFRISLDLPMHHPLVFQLIPSLMSNIDFILDNKCSIGIFYSFFTGLFFL